MWDDIIHDTVFIGETIDDLQQEIQTNTWLISLRAEERASTSREALLNFFTAVMDNRRDQIQRSHVDHGMWFYLWHDQQASQLRFSLISDFHLQLPFDAKTIPQTLETIIEEFLASPDHILFSVLEVSDYDPEEHRSDDNISAYVLPVFKIQLL